MHLSAINLRDTLNLTWDVNNYDIQNTCYLATFRIIKPPINSGRTTNNNTIFPSYASIDH